MMVPHGLDASMNNVLTLLLAGGAGDRLSPLTRDRAKPAVPFGGRYRIIDFTLSNCINSHCRKIQILIQYKSHSLVRHIREGWGIMHQELGEFIDIIPPQMRVNDSWYLGTADAIYQNLYSIDQNAPREVLILAADHIYKMDYQKMLHQHRAAEADLTIGAIRMPRDDACSLGVLEVNPDHAVLGFEEKPESPQMLPDDPTQALCSMGIYVFNTEVLRRVLKNDAQDPDSDHDFGKDVIPAMLGRYSVQAHPFVDENDSEEQYWRDVGTLDAYYEANMDLVSVAPHFNLYDADWPLRTKSHNRPPAKFVFADIGNRCGMALDSIVCGGSILSGGKAQRCVLGCEVRINSNSDVEDSILFDGVEIGRNCRIRRAIIEKHVHIPDNTIIGYDAQEDAQRFFVTHNGVVVVERSPQAESPATLKTMLA